MAKNHAAKRAAKAAKRKSVVAAKRKQEIAENSTMGRLRLAAGLPILHCLVSEELFELGMGCVMLVRGARLGQAFMAAFMVDTLALGVKEVILRWGDTDEIEETVEVYQTADPMAPTPPAEALKLLHDVVAWADSVGFGPAADFVPGTRLFGDTVMAETDYRPRFGKDGKPLYIPGPTETPAQIRRRLATLESTQGVEGMAATLQAVTEHLMGEMDADELEALADVEAELEALDDDALADLAAIEGELADDEWTEDAVAEDALAEDAAPDRPS